MFVMKRSTLWAVVGLVTLAGCSGTPATTPNTISLSPVSSAPPRTVVLTSPPTTNSPTTSPMDGYDPLSAVGGVVLEVQRREAEARQAVEVARDQHGRCGEWRDLALEVGWTAEEWEWLSGTMYRESRCQPDAWNGHDAGLVQINQVHSKRLAERGWKHPDDMFDPRANLTYALFLYREQGCRPWRYSNSCPGS